MKDLELSCFKIISAVGEAKSDYIEAMRKARDNRLEEARECLVKGKAISIEGHKAHAELIQKEANGEDVKVNLLLLHAEDQLMTAETVYIMAEEIIELYERQHKI
ncbi:MAG: PTS lactose/cellobiose transporter subunit IIA [Anaerorhabdus sp.]